LKNLSTDCKLVEEESIDIVCPILAAFTNSLSQLNTSNVDFYDTIGQLTPDFQKEEDISEYVPDVYQSVVFQDYRYTQVRDLMAKDNSNSLIGFFDSRKKKKLMNSFVGATEVQAPRGNHSRSQSVSIP
jgi:hypothetical protein